MKYTKRLIEEGKEVLRSRIPSGVSFIYDEVDNIKYQKWVMNCISFLSDVAPEHVRQIEAIYDPQYNVINKAEQIFGIVSSAAEYLKHKHTLYEGGTSIKKRPASHYNLDFLHPRLKEKCADHLHSEKFDDVILNACKVLEVYTRELARLKDTDIGISLMRKAFNPSQPILKYSDNTAEQESLSHLFSGFIGFFKNPQSHRFMEIKDPLIAFEVLNFANYLCKILEQTEFQK